MKNLFLSVVLLLTVSFAFAANDVETVSAFDDVTVELTNSVELANADFTMENDATYTVSSVEDVSCGFTFTISDGDFSWATEIDCDGWGDSTWNSFMQDILDWLLE